MRQLQIHAQHSAVNERPKRNDVMKLMTMTLNDVRLPAPHTLTDTLFYKLTHTHTACGWTKRNEAKQTERTRRDETSEKYETRTTYTRSVANEYIILNSVGERTKRWMQQLPTDWVYLYLWSCQTATQRQQQQQQQIHTHTHTHTRSLHTYACAGSAVHTHTFRQPLCMLATLSLFASNMRSALATFKIVAIVAWNMLLCCCSSSRVLLLWFKFVCLLCIAI